MHRNRVKVTLNDDASAAIRRLSLLSGESMSGIIAVLLEPNVSTLDEIAELMEKAKKMQADLPAIAGKRFLHLLEHVGKELTSAIDIESVTKCPEVVDTPDLSLVKKAKKLTVSQALSQGLMPADSDSGAPVSDLGKWFSDPDGKDFQFSVYDV